MRKIKYSPLNRVEGWVHKNLASLFVFMFVFGLGFLAALGCSLEKDKPETELPPVELIVPTEVVTPTPVEEVDTADTLEYYFNVPLSYGLQDWIRVLCEEKDVPMALVMAIIERESYFDADLISGTADYGLMQINTCNHEAMVEMFGITDFLDPYQNVQCGIYIIGTHLQKTKGDIELALMRYNNGATGARKLWDKGVYFTQYSESVMKLYEKYKEEYDAYQ